MILLNKHKKALSILTWMLCVVFVAQVVNKGVYFHSHMLNNGTVVSHAHPFQKASDTEPIKKHQHSDSGYVLLNQLNILFVVAFVVAVLALMSKVFIHVEDGVQQYFSGYISHKLGRAPPCF